MGHGLARRYACGPDQVDLGSSSLRGVRRRLDSSPQRQHDLAILRCERFRKWTEPIALTITPPTQT
ncbi:hypothetical protein EMIT0P176_150037 [Pseudomonas sp. IT-P176]